MSGYPQAVLRHAALELRQAQRNKVVVPTIVGLLTLIRLIEMIEQFPELLHHRMVSIDRLLLIHRHLGKGNEG